MATTDAFETAGLPVWDLSDLYAAPDSPALRDDLAALEAAARAFHEKFAGRIAAAASAEIGQAIAAYEALQDRIGRIASYAQLLHAQDLTDPETSRFAQDVREQVNAITSDLLFFTLELNRLSDADLAQHLAHPDVARYRPWLDNLRVWRPHELSDDLERLLHEKSVSSASAWTRLFDETLAALRFEVEDQSLSLEQALNLLSDGKRERRRVAADVLGAVFDDNARLFALISNVLAKDKDIEDRWRRYPSPASARHLANLVEPEVVEALEHAVQASYPRTSHRYYALKARWMGLDRLKHFDRNAPLPESEERPRSWGEAREMVLGAYERFSPEMASIGRRFFDRPWIDVPARPGKASGAFAHPTVPSAHPYLLLNYQGKVRDVMTLAHELGHGVHQVLAGAQGALMAGTPLTLAETASVFGEQLVFRAVLEAETDPARRKALLASKVEDMINTVVRQMAFYRFERRVHDERKSGELAAERFAEIWMDVQGASLGPAFDLEPSYRNYWTYISHFVHAPFYVYAYAFGDCLVNSLYAVYQSADEGFAARYLDMLRAGGTLRHKELLAPFGLDAGDPAFWSQGLGVISRFIDELEAMDEA